MGGKSNFKKIDEHIGARVRAARNLASMTQEGLGEKLGITVQQIQKYEKGANRVSCGALVKIASVFDRDISWFFEGVPDIKGGGKSAPDHSMIFFGLHGAAELAIDYVRLDPKRRLALRQIAGIL